MAVKRWICGLFVFYLMDWKLETLSIFDAAYRLLYQSLHIKSDTKLATLHTMDTYILPSTPNVANADIFQNKTHHHADFSEEA